MLLSVDEGSERPKEERMDCVRNDTEISYSERLTEGNWRR